MSFVIANIKNTPLRRAVLLIAFIPIVVAGAIFYGFLEACSVLGEAIESFGPAWRGR